MHISIHFQELFLEYNTKGQALSTMILLNFSHPITEPQLVRIEELTTASVDEIRTIPAHFDNQQPFGEQVRALADAAGLSPEEWQTTPILINPPAYNFAAVMLFAELHGRMGHFPAIVRVRPVRDAIPPRYEVAEIVDLQAMRNAARLPNQKGASRTG